MAPPTNDEAIHDTHPDRPGIVDLRSDTFTQPTTEMRAAVADAAVGDALFSEDPTVTKLEHDAARVLGKEAALFVPSGSMGNLVALLTTTAGRGGPGGGEIICDRSAHLLNYESGALSSIAGCQSWPIDSEHGIFTADDVQRALRPSMFVYPLQSLVAIENTVNDHGGRVWTADQASAIAEVAKQAGLRTHCDGARIWHAAVAQGTTPARLTEGYDTVMACLSKALSAPVGSILAADADTIDQAIRMRKMVGGAMRQAGVIAAAAQVALDTMRDRLSDDHARAQTLARGLADAGFGTDPKAHPTNIVLADTRPLGLDAEHVMQQLAERGVLALPTTSHTLRFVTHRHITDDKTKQACDAFQEVASNAR